MTLDDFMDQNPDDEGVMTLKKFMKRNPDDVGWGEMIYRIYAPRLLPYLLWCAINRKLMTYGGLARNVRFPRKYQRGSALGSAAGYLAGYIGSYCAANKLPPLNALVVNQRNLLPAIGATPHFIRYGIESYDELDPEEQQTALANNIYPLIFQPGIWVNLLKVNRIKPLKPKHITPYKQGSEKIEEIRLPVPQQQGSAGESEAHKALKRYVVENCEDIENLRLLGCTQNNAEMEHLLPSMDRPDIFFNNEDFGVACEIKSWRSNEDDLLRGIFQCVKYKALLNAIDVLKGRRIASECVLVVQKKLPRDLQRMANRLRVPQVRLSQRMVGN